MKIDIPLGIDIYQSVEYAIYYAYNVGTEVSFKFNDIELEVHYRSYKKTSCVFMI